jgi:sensor histidine kinase regulating citrate/malate metabolism
MRHEDEKHYEMNKATIQLIDIKCHDLRHQIRTLKNSGQVISKDELQSIEDAIHIYDTRMKTGNQSLDVILQEKSLICKQNNIVFNCILDGSALSFMKESDIYSLFGNIVDNAIESSMKIANPDQRVITLKIHKVANGVFAYEENRYVGDLVFKDGLPVSTKGDDRYHGFGMKSIRMIVESYHGTMNITTKDGVFALSLYFLQES